MTVTSTDTAWKLISTELRSAVGRDLYEVWLAPLRLESIGDREVTISAPPATRRWIEDRFAGVIAKSVRGALGAEVELSIVEREPGGSDKTARAGSSSGSTRDSGPEPAPMPSRQPSPKYSFEQFVIGPENRFAHGAALSVAENPGVTYNPLFICGPPGVGKTHLLHAVASYASRHDGCRVLLTNAEDFASSFVDALRTRRMDEFKAHHRQVDMILVDDVQFLMDKAKTEEEFFHTFNALSENGAQIVLACDRLPPQLDRLEERLRDRFGSGLVAAMGLPDITTRVAALRKRAAVDGIELRDDRVLSVLAELGSKGNLRSLESALIRVVAYASLSGEELTPELAEKVLRELGHRAGNQKPVKRGDVSVEQVAEIVARSFSLQTSDLAGPGRSARVSWARQVAMYLARSHTRSSTSSIGAYFGGRTHSAVLYACRRTEEKMSADEESDREVRTLSATLAADVNS